jgi:hypothetical protein
MRDIRVGIAIALVGVACDKPGTSPDASVPPPPDAAPIDPRQTVAELPVTPNRDLDLLFVIDDSPSMLDKQVNLVANFPVFINRLEQVPGGLPNLHLGVVTPDMGTKASGSPTPGPAIGQIGQGGCAALGKAGALQTYNAPVTGRFLVDVEAAGGGRTRNYAGTLNEAFGMMARAGAGGCGFEQPLAAVRAALDNNPMNSGFLRPAAILGIVFLTDEDDCSAKSTALFGPESPAVGPLQSFRCTRFGVTCAVGGQTSDAMNQPGNKDMCGANPASDFVDDVAPYRDFLRGLKSDPTKVIVGGIMGPPQPFAVELRAPPGGGTPTPAIAHSCVYTGQMNVEVADPAARLRGFFDGFPDRSTFTTICQRNLADALEKIAGLLRTIVGDPCIQGIPADVDLETPGPQYECAVSDVQKPGTAEAVETVIPACNTALSNKPCWHIAVDADRCPADDQLALKIERSVDPPPDTHIIANCVTEAN